MKREYLFRGKSFKKLHLYCCPDGHGRVPLSLNGLFFSARSRHKYWGRERTDSLALLAAGIIGTWKWSSVSQSPFLPFPGVQFNSILKVLAKWNFKRRLVQSPSSWWEVREDFGKDFQDAIELGPRSSAFACKVRETDRTCRSAGSQFWVFPRIRWGWGVQRRETDWHGWPLVLGCLWIFGNC